MGRDWDVAAYARFGDLRLRPALDLLARVGVIPPGDVIDLGCGAGAAAGALRAGFPDRRLVGVDASPAMLARARATGVYDALVEADIARWRPERPPALVFSNAALHWLGDHPRLIGSLLASICPGGVLAVQMPRQWDEPSHLLLRETAAALFPDRFDWTGWRAPVSEPAVYAALLARAGADPDIWETVYHQRVRSEDGAHPVRGFTASTAARPILDRLDPGEARRFLAAYDRALATAYPVEPDGSAWFPFRRLFFRACRPGPAG